MPPSPQHCPPPVPPTGRSPPPTSGWRRGGLGSGRGCRQRDRGGTAGWRARTRSAGTWSKEDAKKGFESCEKAKQWKLGQIRTNFVRISQSRESVNLAISLWAKIARETHTMAPSYEQNTAKSCEIHGTVNLGFKRPVHEGYNVLLKQTGMCVICPSPPACHALRSPTPLLGLLSTSMKSNALPSILAISVHPGQPNSSVCMSCAMQGHRFQRIV